MMTPLSTQNSKLQNVSNQLANTIRKLSYFGFQPWKMPIFEVVWLEGWFNSTMQVVILAGGLGTRLSEETDLIPKPMVRIGPDPILVHIMRYYAFYGHCKFLIAAGYKHKIISDFFLPEYLLIDLLLHKSINSLTVLFIKLLMIEYSYY